MSSGGTGAHKNASMRPSLSRVRGLGSAQEGRGHWWAQRVTAIALAPLIVWFVAGVVGHAGAGHAAVAAWIGGPITATLTVVLLLAAFYHAQLGLTVVIEDYVHSKPVKLVALLVVKGAAAVLAVAATISVLKLAFAV
jgi:succinate dehydrogenase / fumarate reductase, membrane anchor subunit